MASAFWTLEDGRGFSVRWTGMAYMLQLITHELSKNAEAKNFFEYLEYFVFSEENGDEPNGYGGFIRGNEDIMFNLDLRTFASRNRAYFWAAAQTAMARLKTHGGDNDAGLALLFTSLLDMHKRIKKGEDPMAFNHLRTIRPEPEEKLGPGW